MKNKTLDLRYNELWNDGDDVYGQQEKTDHVHGRQSLSWRNLSVSVKQITEKFFKRSEVTYKKILDNINGNVHCGTLLGIMGSSGSGKTTLVATISHRMKGNFGGELLFNGRPISEKLMVKISGFVPQHDISFDQLTVREHLTLMAILKMDRQTTQAGVGQRIDYTIVKLGMSQFLNTRISYLSGGERKKVALAVQLLSDPPILFCDEITTGLDSYSAAHIISTLKGVARTGKIVVCTIHQPASGVYGKFDEVLLLSNGRLVYQGPIPMVRQLFEKFNYECPRMFNEADYVISVLNSDCEKVKRDVDEMCKVSLSDILEDIDFDSFDNHTTIILIIIFLLLSMHELILPFLLTFRYVFLTFGKHHFENTKHDFFKKELDYMQHLQTKKPLWIIQSSLIFNRSMKCFLRSYPSKLLELGTILSLGILTSSPYANMTFDSRAVQNWEGFWLMVIINCFVRTAHSSILIYHIQFSIIHREIHNEVYSLSAYYTSELIIMVVWTMIKMLFFCIPAFTIVGVEWGSMELFVIFMVAFTALSYGTLLSSCFNNISNAMLCASVYDYLALPISGTYLSFKSLPKLFYYLRFFSLYFLGCEVVSILFWEKIPHLPCSDVNKCSNSGQAVLNKYGYKSDDFYFDIMIMISFCILANVCGYFGLLKRIRRQPAY